MRRSVLLPALMALTVLLFSTATGSEPAVGQVSSGKPNFVFILADDMRADDLNYMHKTHDLFGEQGMRFDNAYVSLASCCPSRATIMRGQYAHNHGVWGNANGPDGGWQGYQNHGNESDNLATRFHDAGYRTGLFGKYLNGYRGTAVPPGWDAWFATFRFPYFDYDVNDNGTIRHFGTSESDYSTDVISKQTLQFIDASVAEGKPFFAYVAPVAPHSPSTPAPRDEHAFDGKQAPRTPSFNEEDVSDKPPWIQSLPSLDSARTAKIDAKHERRVESLQAVDDLVEEVVKKVEGEEKLENTYVVFTSDNGQHLGEHRIQKAKNRPYEESVHVPLLIRGPGVQKADPTTNKLVLNTDFFPTFTDLAGIQTPDYVDGRSLRPLLEGSTSTWRTAILLEHVDTTDSGRWFYGIRTSDGKKYVEYEEGFRELYDLEADPYELANSYYDSTPPPMDLAPRLEALKDCTEDSCRAAEDES